MSSWLSHKGSKNFKCKYTWSAELLKRDYDYDPPNPLPHKILKETQNAVVKQCNALKFQSGLKYLYFTELIFKDGRAMGFFKWAKEIAWN